MWRLAVLLLPIQAFHDDDCQLVPHPVVPWKEFLQILGKEDWEGARGHAELIMRKRSESRHECPLGYAAACLYAARSFEVADCLQYLSVVRLLASRWPLFRLTARIQGTLQSSVGDCSELEHPSVDWEEVRKAAVAFTEKLPPWIKGQAESDAVPVELEEALAHAEAITWKASSAAVTPEGVTIAEWTSQCSHGVLSAYIMRAFGMVLTDGDVYRNVQRNLETAQMIVDKVGLFLQSPWPVFDILHTLSLIKKRLHDLHVPPEDFMEPGSIGAPAQRSAMWQGIEKQIISAKTESGAILLTSLPMHRVDFLFSFFKRSKKLGFSRHVLAIPLKPNISETCHNIADMFVQSKHPDVPDGWSPCLPFVSQFPDTAQYIYIYIALLLQVTVFWFDFHVVWVQSPLAFMENALTRPSQPPQYHHPCRPVCPTVKTPDLWTLDDFYQPGWPKSSIFLVRGTKAALEWLDVYVEWLMSYPFAVAYRGFQFMVHSNKQDVVPSVSLLPPGNMIPQLEVAELNAELQFVSDDGWFGDIRDIISFEVGPQLAEQTRVKFLNSLLEGSDDDVDRSLRLARKRLSPLRPTHRLYDIFQGEAEEMATCTWQQVPDAFIGGYAQDFAGDVEDLFEDAATAQCKCIQLGAACAGVTCDELGESDSGRKCTLRRGEPQLAASPTGEVSFWKQCPQGGCDAPPIERIVHVNFADGCCEVEQRQSSETALKFGADETRPLRGDFLDAEFRERNHALLTFNRTPELTQHKTPSGKIGYYVWKPYVVLKTLEDENLPWHTSIVLWTDAGIHFVGDIKKLVHKYMPFTDVAATRTPMLEADFSKRDAFILMDADYFGIRETPQIATGVIIARKTPLAIEFMRKWLQACEEPRIMTEEASVLGFPEYLTFKNNNDDQTAFSLLFKRHGFSAFSVGERGEMVYTGRNLAKFIKASDDFALGKKSDREAYLTAADEAAKSTAE